MQSINASQEAERISAFLKNILKKTGKKNIIIGWSGGIDSTVCLFLLQQAISSKNIFIIHMPYDVSYIKEMAGLTDIPKENIKVISIKKIVDAVAGTVQTSDNIRQGNIMARIRMILLFDFAKKIDGLVCGTENKSEHLLGYFTRFGDEASDVEPIRHLYKTEVYQLARFLKIPSLFISKKPSADLWHNQTDEGEFGFSYEQADSVLRGKIKGIDIKIVKKVQERIKRNSFKHKVPFILA